MLLVMTWVGPPVGVKLNGSRAPIIGIDLISRRENEFVILYTHNKSWDFLPTRKT